MSLQFVIGASGSGKSTAVYKRVLQESKEYPQNQYFIIVPDQFTMQTQMDFVTMSPCGGILNIDILSFNRLAHRIFEEVGADLRTVLDDTGKSLVLERIASGISKQVPVLGANLDKQGYIHEIKSAISEFMQYGIDEQKLQQLIDFSEKKGALCSKLKDLLVLYHAFCAYLGDHYITTEERMDVLCEKLYQSKIIKNAIVVFDGFTGFTPIQVRVIGTLMELCKQVIVTVTMDEKEMVLHDEGEQNLFHLCHKTIASLVKTAEERNIEVAKHYCLKGEPVKRYQDKEDLAFLEQHLFRYPPQVYHSDSKRHIHISTCMDMREEIEGVCHKIRELLTQSHCAYRDIAVITGDLSSYETLIEEEFTQNEIPFFMDRTRGILLNPFTEMLRASLEILTDHFSYESVFHYLRSGLADFTKEETDDLENYVLELGITGKKNWTHPFYRKTKKMKQMQDATESLGRLENLRRRLIEQLSPMLNETAGKQSKWFVKDQILQLYAFITANNISDKLAVYETMFQEKEDYTRAREYGQIYRMIMELLDQMMDLIGNEKITRKEFYDILDAGFSEMEVGSIPMSVDRVTVGDVERTRLKPVKYLFFIGINDGSIPQNSTKGGILSDLDREFLTEGAFELAPSPRQQVYIQKYYLYLIMTKPSEELFLSSCGMDAEGKALRPSYLITTMEYMFPDAVEHDSISLTQDYTKLQNLSEVKTAFNRLIRGYAQNQLTVEQTEEFMHLLIWMKNQASLHAFLKQSIQNAFLFYENHPLSKLSTTMLYGQTLLSSISRMEQFASCAYSFFLKYGLSLQERAEYGFEDRDIGSIFHGVMENFSVQMENGGYTWNDVPLKDVEGMVGKALREVCMNYTEAVLYDSATNLYQMERMKRIMTRTVNTIAYQIRKGSFTPKAYELSFSVTENIGDIDISLTQDEKMRLSGRIDRVDTLEDGDNLLVKVVDYKSGNRNFDLMAFYRGLQLQLVIYMNEAMKSPQINPQAKNAVPAAMLYYHIMDPMIESEGQEDEETIQKQILQELCTKGIVNDDRSVIEEIDQSIETKSDCIPVAYKKDGSFTSTSSVFSNETIDTICQYALLNLKRMAGRILKGDISLRPVAYQTQDACQYCSFRQVCGFDEKICGFGHELVQKISDTEILEKIQIELAGKEKSHGSDI